MTWDGEPALFFMPGWCSDRTVFQDLVLHFCAYHRTLALDWRGHGESGSPKHDFGNEALLSDALAVIESSKARQVIPVALAHSGWIAIELRRRLGLRIPKLILVDWILIEPSQQFLEVLKRMQDPDRWKDAVEAIFSLWLQDVDNPRLINFVRKVMGSYGFDMWARAAREISKAYAESGSPLCALSLLSPSVSVLHIYAQPPDPNYLTIQQEFASSHPWFSVYRLKARSHFPMFEVPDEMAIAIEQFIKQR
ncbi:1H-3-hydroxy-4-oxoquinaldine 2,4-dioxygenase [archaeon HR04]|nr:1H-3-hydroxy-4-oxoquinaldine 2,4-dioxygenase [archaeon HR04]